MKKLVGWLLCNEKGNTIVIDRTSLIYLSKSMAITDLCGEKHGIKKVQVIPYKDNKK